MTGTNAGVGISEGANRQRVKATALQVIQDRFSHIQPVWVERHLTVLIALRTQFGADIDKTIIIGLIAQRMMRMKETPTIDYQTVLAGEVSELHGRFTNVESIAAASGIPRETVRRKVGELEAIGWVRRNERGQIDLTSLPTHHLDGITRMTMDLLASVFEAINHELHRPDTSSPST